MDSADKIKIIFDTDIGEDCDDAGALALCHALCELGEAELLAVTSCYATPYVAGCIDAINSHYGRVVPVGINYEKPYDRNKNGGSGYKGYDEEICKKFPNRFKTSENVPDTLAVLRKTLANVQDSSVTMVVTGTLSSMARLIRSGADDISPLTGKELVAKKIKRTVVMGGRFFETWAEPIVQGGKELTAEYNIRMDIPSAQIVCNEWCGELVFSSSEIGLWCISLKEFSKRAHINPAARAYELFPNAKGNGRESWDLTAMLYAIRPHAGYWCTQKWGKINVDDSGITSFETNDAYKHTYLTPNITNNELSKILDSVVRKSKFY